ncbi:MAG: response regulator [Armatimonadia bacterium]
MDKKLVLVVEDERTIATLLAHLVRSCGVRVEVAHHGKKALEMMRAQKPDLVLLDLIMPIMSGPELLATMDVEPDLKDVPVVVISTAEEPGEAVEREVRHLRKPFEPSEVKQVVREMLGMDSQGK